MLPEQPASKTQSFWEKLKKEAHFLEVLRLMDDYSTENIRRVAISLRRQMQEKGLNAESVKALQWALNETQDCQTDKEFLSFLLDDASFEDLDISREQ